MLYEGNVFHRPWHPTLICFPSQVKVALCQLLVTADKEKNINTARTAIKVLVLHDH
jgi:hypothetical protein